MFVDEAITSNMFFLPGTRQFKSLYCFSKQNECFPVNLTLHDTAQQSQAGFFRLFMTQ